MTEHHVSSGAARLFVTVDGPADAPVLLLSNSLAADHRMWDAQMPWLTKAWRVVRYDTRGHGASSTPPGPWSFADLVGDQRAILDDLRAPSATVMGLSLGGMTALGFGLDHPERCARLIVCCARADNPGPFVASWDDRIAAVRGTGLAGIVEGTLARWFTPACPPATVEAARRMMLATDPEGYIAAAETLKSLDYLKDLPGMRCPATYLAGADDLGAPAATMQAMAAATPGARFVSLAGLAHVPNMEDPAAFAAALPELSPGARA